MRNRNLSLYQETINCSINKLAETILQIAQSSSANPVVVYRIKDPKTLAKKMHLKGARSVFDISDVYGFRVLVSSTGEIYTILQAIRESFTSYIDHDYIKTPKTRPDKPHLKGKSLRLLQIVVYKNKVPFQVQITTHEFDKSNEELHDEYHSEKYK